MSRKPHLAAVFSMVMIAGLILVSCGGTEQPTATPVAAPEKTITISFTTGDPEGFNPLYATTWITEIAFDMLLLPLWNIDDNGEYHMELAVELPTVENGGISPDGLTVTIPLRPEAVWSDGEPVTARDAVFTYDMILNDANGVFSRYPFDTYVASMTAQDEHTLVIQFSEPYVDWATSIFTGISRIIPEHVLGPVFEAEGTLDNADWNRLADVVNGPFLVTEFEPASHLTFVANDLYWRGRPNLDKVFFLMMEDRPAQLAALASGQSDIGSYIIGSEIPQIEAMGNMRMLTSPNGYSVFIFLNIDPNTTHPAMTDPNVRRALALAIDRQSIIDNLYNGIYTIPSTYWEGSLYDNPDLEPYPFDPAGARSLLEQAGWVDTNGDGVREKEGLDLTLRYVYISGDETTDTMVVAIQQMLADVGVGLDILPNTQEVLWASYADNGTLARGGYDLTHWVDGMWYYPSPDTGYFLCSERPSPDYPEGYNWFGICDPELDDLFTQQVSLIDQQERIQVFHQIGQIMSDQTYLIPVRTDPDVWSVSDRLEDVVFSGVDPLMFIYQWDLR